ncbi:unnamed protein product [Symbiodinium microadriaticum]|nr:unnamed protein product [Symbiodinium microadriaticum]
MLAEAEKFPEMINDPDAWGLVADLKAGCIDGGADLVSYVEDLSTDLHQYLTEDEKWSPRDEMNDFLGFCAGVNCDAKITQREAELLLHKFKESPVLMTHKAFTPLHLSLKDVLADRMLDDDEAIRIGALITKLVSDSYADTGLANIGETASMGDLITDPTQIRIEDSRFVLTGPMAFAPRKEIAAMIEAAGGFYQAGPNRQTDYMVVAGEASPNWATTHFGTKLEKANHINSKGGRIQFVAETALETFEAVTEGRFIRGFDWALPRAYAEAVGACQFQGGDCFYPDPIAYDAPWEQATQEMPFHMQVSKPERGSLTPGGSDRLFDQNWGTQIEVVLYHTDGSPPRTFETCQGGLYTALWHGNPGLMDLDAPPAAGTKTAQAMITRAGIEVHNQFPDANGFLMAVDECNATTWRKLNEIRSKMHAIKGFEILFVRPDDLNIQADPPYKPTVYYALFQLPYAEHDKIHDLVKEAVYRPNPEAKNPRFDLERHGVIV